MIEIMLGQRAGVNLPAGGRNQLFSLHFLSPFKDVAKGREMLL